MHCMFYTRDRNVWVGSTYIFLKIFAVEKQKICLSRCFYICNEGFPIAQIGRGKPLIKPRPFLFRNQTFINKGFQTMFILILSNDVSFVFYTINSLWVTMKAKVTCKIKTTTQTFRSQVYVCYTTIKAM